MKRIKLSQGKYALVDNEDFEKVNQHKWNYTSTKYASRNKKIYENKYEQEYMHRFILNASKEFKIDHINHNGLDNRKCNLRICTVSENSMNQRAHGGKSKYKGIYWDKKYNKWRALIGLNGKQIHIGRYTNEITAALAYDVKAIELYGKFAYLNFGEKL